jgi:hypothetical protein
MIWQGAAISTPPYGFWFAGMTLGTGYLYTAFVMDPVVSVAEDPDPVVFHIGAKCLEGLSLSDMNGAAIGAQISASSIWTSACGGTTAGNFAYIDSGKTAFVRVQPLQYVCTGPQNYYLAPVGGAPQITVSGSNGYSAIFLGPNQFNSQYDALPVPWVRAALPDGTGTFCGGLKGWSTMLRWTTVYRTSFSDTMDDKRWICVGPFWLPWDGATTPRND